MKKQASHFFLFLLTLILTLFLCLPWVSAKAKPKPKPQAWEINGIVAALDDARDEVKKLAFNLLGEYDLQNLQLVGQKPEDIALKFAKLIKDEKLDKNVRGNAALALGNLGQAAAKYVPDILQFLKDENVDSNVRYRAAEALGNMEQAAAKYIPNILQLLKDEKVDSLVRGRAALALGNLEQATKYVPDILQFLKDEKVNLIVRYRAAVTLGNLEQATKYVPDILQFLKDEKVNSNVRGSVAVSLGNLGQAAAKYVPDIAQILKNKNVNSHVRGSAAEALGNMGQAAANYVPDILQFLKDEKVDSEVRGSVAEALGNMGQAAAKYVPDILQFLKDEKVDLVVRRYMALALRNMGQAAAKYVLDIAQILKDEKVDSGVRGNVAEALGNLREVTTNYVPNIAQILKDEKVNSDVRGSVAVALGNLGQAAVKYVPNILQILKDEKVDSTVRGNAAEALGNMGQAAANYIPDILQFLKDEKVNSDVRSRVAEALRNMGQAAANYIPDIAQVLKDEKVDSHVRGSVAVALGNLGQSAAKYVPDILQFLKDENVDSGVRYRAAVALGNMGQTAAKYIPDIAQILKDEKVDSHVRSSAAVALGNMGQAAANYVPDILQFLKDEKVDSGVRGIAAGALGKIRQLKLEEVVVVLNFVYEPNQGKFGSDNGFELWRFGSYFLGGGTDEVKTLLTWLGRPKATPDKLTHAEGVKTLEVFRQVWEPSQGLGRLQEDLAKQIAVVARKVSWEPQDIVLLETHYNNLKKAGHNEADSLEAVIVNLKGWQWLFNARTTILIHAAFWLALIFAYPKFPQVQAIFFWNPWVRRILGVGYVGLILTWVPYFRTKLFEPFQPSLLADAGLDNFNPEAYFPNSQVQVPGVEEPVPISQVLPSIKGQIVLEGDSGLGKSMFLRYLVKTSSRLVVYLPARKCDKGVIEAIQAKLHGQAQDADFLKHLIYSGALDICIDGLNEVTAETRAKICQFVESYFRGNIIMTTQPLEWTPPATAKIYKLLPLEQQQIEEFLVSRKPRLPKNAKVQGSDYEQATANFLAKALTPQQSPQELSAVQKVLSNPMDLTVVALMLSQGEAPDLFNLQRHQYQLMATEYLQEWKQEFPLKKFSEAVYEMRLNDEQALPAEEFYQVLQSLEDDKYKMVVSRQWQDEKGEAKKEWYFRHDKIMEFFLVQNFLGDSAEVEQRLIDHMGDPRFRGVYFLLATLLPLDAAKELREKIIQYAADTKDHTVSDTFVQLLRPRAAA